MRHFAAEKFSSSMRSLAGSWEYFRQDFAPEFERLRQEGALLEGGPSEKIWETKSRFVLKVPLSQGGFAVYKRYRRIERPSRFMLRPSPCGFEAYNYQLLGELGIPLPELLAAGDTREHFRLRTAFIMTKFAEGFRDGREFLPGGALAEEKELRTEFISRNFRLLARCHDACVLHRGFNPANLLFKVRSAPDEAGNRLELLWIDLASCRRRPRFLVNFLIVHDFRQFFRFFDFSEEEKKTFLDGYCRARKVSPPGLARLCRGIF